MIMNTSHSRQSSRCNGRGSRGWVGGVTSIEESREGSSEEALFLGETRRVSRKEPGGVWGFQCDGSGPGGAP